MLINSLFGSDVRWSLGVCPRSFSRTVLVRCWHNIVGWKGHRAHNTLSPIDSRHSGAEKPRVVSRCRHPTGRLRTGVKPADVDVLIVDTETMDAVIVLSFLSMPCFRPHAIVAEISVIGDPMNNQLREVLHGAGYQFDMGDSRNMFAWQTHDQGTMCAAGTGVDDTIGATRRERASREPSHVR